MTGWAQKNGETIWNDVVSGYANTPLIKVTKVVMFDDRTEVLCDREDIRKVRPMTGKQYYVRGCTALLDAVGGAIRHIGNVHRYIRPEDVSRLIAFRNNPSDESWIGGAK